MKPLDFAKALGVALAVMFVNVLISFVVVAIYGYAIAPGHEDAFYQEAAKRIAPWSSVVFGAPLFFGAAYWLARQRPDRNAIAFAVSCVAIYAVIDLSVFFAAGGVASMIGIVLLSLVTKLIGAYAGAHFAAKKVKARG
ncbi:MAG: hypothetical protein ACKVZ0_12610 [Gemmatimonadales bacterium]